MVWGTLHQKEQRKKNDKPIIFACDLVLQELINTVKKIAEKWEKK